ncbi:MAG: PAS domain S-box protein [Pseudomonadota bacterium]
MDDELRKVIEMSDAGIVILDEDYNISFVNKSASELTGYQIEEFLGMNFMDIFSTENKKIIKVTIAGYKIEESIRSCSEIEILTAQGNRKETEICIAITRGSNGTIKIYAYLRDISERKKSEAILIEFLDTGKGIPPKYISKTI